MSRIISSIAVALTLLLAAPLASNHPVAALSGALLRGKRAKKTSRKIALSTQIL